MGFTVQGEPSHATVVGPEDILPIVYVVEQPDSPIEIVSVDLQGMCFLFPASNIQSGTVDSIKSGIEATGSSSGLMLSSWLAAPVAQGGPEQVVRRRSHQAKPSRLRRAVEVAMVEHLEIT